MRINTTHKIFTLILILSFFTSFNVPKSYAVWGVLDTGIDPTVTGTTAATTGTTASSAGSNVSALVKDFALDVVAYTLAQELANYLVSKFTTWVNNGFDGNPFYVPDQKSFMAEFQDTEILKLYDSFGDGMSSITDKGVITSMLESQKIPFTEKLKSTISDAQSKAFSTSFKKGGWDAWEEMAKPSNNALGRAEMIKNEYTSRVEKAQQMAKNELAQGEGYLGKKKCAAQGDTNTDENTFMGPPPAPAEETGPPPAPGGGGSGSCTGGMVWDNEGGLCVSAGLAEGATVDGNAGGLGNAFRVELQNFTYDPSCERWETQTPGKLISSSLNRAASQQFEGLTAADEFSEIASAALGSMVDAMVNKGLSELKSGADNLFNQSSKKSVAGIEYLGSETAAYTAPDGQIDWLNTPKNTVNLELALPDAIANTGTALAILDKNVETRDKFLDIIKDLDYLLPAPDVGWGERLNRLFIRASQDESMFLIRKTGDAYDNRQDRFNTIKNAYVASIAATKSAETNPKYFAYPISYHGRILGYIGQIGEFGRKYKTTKQERDDMRIVFYRLKAIKDEIMGTDYNIGYYDELSNSWVGDTWFTAERTLTNELGEEVIINNTANAWENWRNVGITDGQIDLVNGEPVQAVKIREELRKQFMSIQQDVPQKNILERIRNQNEQVQFTLKDMNELLYFSEQFWADNYRLDSNGNEDFDYWKAFYREFTPYISRSVQDWSGDYIEVDFSNDGPDWQETTGSNGDTIAPRIARIMKTASNLGKPFRKISYPGPGPSGSTLGIPDDYGGPWGYLQPRGFPPHWNTDPIQYPQHVFQPTATLQQYVGPNYTNARGISMAQKLREIEKSNFKDSGTNLVPPIVARFLGMKVRAYSMSVMERPWVVEPWNILRRDREQRLFCGFQSDNDRLSDTGDNSNKRYEPIFCSDGWYRASDIDYMMMYDLDFKASVATAGM